MNKSTFFTGQPIFSQLPKSGKYYENDRTKKKDRPSPWSNAILYDDKKKNRVQKLLVGNVRSYCLSLSVCCAKSVACAHVACDYTVSKLRWEEQQGQKFVLASKKIMKTQKEIEELLNSGEEPEGITVRSSDGKMFFISKEDAKPLAIPSTALTTAYYFSSLNHPRHPQAENHEAVDNCNATKEWLDTHSPDSERWRRLCEYYFFGSGCV
jgi:hypothetical protein